MEYIAFFWAVLFPGALVAFNYELLQALDRVAALRVYCAGIWHNASACVICAMALFLLPTMLDPFYIHGGSPMVLDVSPASPLSVYLSPGDFILSLSGTSINNVQQWKEAIASLNDQMLSKFHNSSNFKDPTLSGYCVPQYLVNDSMAAQVDDSGTFCGDELYAFSDIPCLDSNAKDETKDGDYFPGEKSQRRSVYCFNPKDVIMLKRCGGSWVKGQNNTMTCPCSEEESCFASVQMPGLAWVEITYLSARGCSQSDNNTFPYPKNADFGGLNCTQTFVFVGDATSLVRSLQLTSYQPRWARAISMYLPNVLEKLLICTFHVSLSLALLNSLPVFFLDGECIIETIVQYIGFMGPRTRINLLRWILLGGTSISVIVLLRSVFV